jgi:hypothetical protein
MKGAPHWSLQDPHYYPLPPFHVAVYVVLGCPADASHKQQPKDAYVLMHFRGCMMHDDVVIVLDFQYWKCVGFHIRIAQYIYRYLIVT